LTQTVRSTVFCDVAVDDVHDLQAAPARDAPQVNFVGLVYQESPAFPSVLRPVPLAVGRSTHDRIVVSDHHVKARPTIRAAVYVMAYVAAALVFLPRKHHLIEV
jgi:hypothetical protein